MNPPSAYSMEKMQKALDAANARAEKAEAEIKQANEYLDQGWCPQIEADAQGGAPDGMTRLAWRLHLNLRGALNGPEADALCARAKKAERGMAALREALARYRKLDDQHASCSECYGLGAPEACGECFPFADDARCGMFDALADTAAAAEAYEQRIRRDERRKVLEPLQEIAQKIPSDLEIESVRNRDLGHDEFYLFAASGEIYEDCDELGINRWDETCREAGKAITQLVKQLAAFDTEESGT